MSKNEHYVNNKELFGAMSTYIAAIHQADSEGKSRPIVPNYIASCILKIATRLASKHNYHNNRHYDQEMIMDGVENCLRYIHNFNPERSDNPFAYFTQIIGNAFNRRIEKEKKEDYIKHKYTQHTVVLNGVEAIDDIGEDGVTVSVGNESVSDFITSFENHMERKRSKRKQHKKAPEVEESSIFDQLTENGDES